MHNNPIILQHNNKHVLNQIEADLKQKTNNTQPMTKEMRSIVNQVKDMRHGHDNPLRQKGV